MKILGMRIFWIQILVGAVLALAQAYENPTKLLLVQILFRHAERSPVRLYPNDPNPVSVWSEGLGKLTLLGREQAYALGTFFREQYEDFVTSSPNEVTVNSSNADRCVRTALANVAAFFKPSPLWTFDNQIQWQPVPVHSAPFDKDMYLSGRMFCPRSDYELEKVLEQHFKDLVANHKEMLDDLSQHSGLSMDSVLDLALFEDTLEIERKHHLEIPKWAENYWDELQTAVEPVVNWYSESPVVRRLRIGPLLGKIVEDMNRKIAGEIPDVKVRLYSTHDIQIGRMLEALSVSNKMRPPYCSSIVFELYEEAEGERVVRLLYFNSTTPETVHQTPNILRLEGCSDYCPLDHFVDIARHSIPVDWERECKRESSEMY